MFKFLTIEQQKQELLKKKDRGVTFRYPDKSIGKRTGTIEHRSVVFSADNEEDGVVYWDILDVIYFKHDRKPWIRLSYYRYKYKKGFTRENKPIKLGWNFAGQTSLCEPASKIKELLATAKTEYPTVASLIGV